MLNWWLCTFTVLGIENDVEFIVCKKENFLTESDVNFLISSAICHHLTFIGYGALVHNTQSMKVPVSLGAGTVEDMAKKYQNLAIVELN